MTFPLCGIWGRHGPQHQHRLPSAPLVAILDTFAEAGILNKFTQVYAWRHRVSRRTAWRHIRAARARAVVCEVIADQMATALGLHPADIFGSAWEVEEVPA